MSSLHQEQEQRTITPENFPAAVKEERVWINWRMEARRPGAPVTKVPKGVGTNRNIDHTDESNQKSYEEALAAYQKRPDYYAGIGMVFSEDDPYIGVDLDKCIGPDTEEIDPWAQEIIETLDSYTEVSPTGTGVKIWIKGSIAHNSYARKLKELFGEDTKKGIEIYNSVRWFAATGWHYEGTPKTIKSRTKEIMKVARQYFPDKFQSRVAPEAPSSKKNGHKKHIKGIHLEDYLDEHGIDYYPAGDDRKARVKYKLDECPLTHEHPDDPSGAYVFQYHEDDGGPDGALSCRCSHATHGGGTMELWHDFRERSEPGYERFDPANRLQIYSSSKAGDSSDSSDSFSKVENFITTPEFPVDALPPGCAQYVKEASASLSCDPALVGVPVLAALSGAIGYSREIRIKPGWTESASLYLGVVDEPGSRKSPAASLAYKPLEKLQATLRKAYKEEKKTYEEQMRRHAVAKKNAAKEGAPEPEPPVSPVMRRCIVDDITIEALAMRLEQNPRGFLSHQDELTGFLRGMDQYKSGGKGNTRQSYLKMWSNRPIYVDRKGSDEPVVVPRPALTLQGGIQPSVLHEIADGRDDGFLDRFDFAYPEPGRGGYSEKTISYAALSAYEDVIGSLWNRGPHQEDERSGELIPVIIRMEPDAKSLFIAEANNLSTEMAAAGFPKVLRGPWSKFDTKLARLALIIALSRCAVENPEVELVTARDMEAALRLLDYFKATARKVYGQLFEANPDDVLAADIKTLLTKTGYVFIGSISELKDVLESEALPDSPESLGRALRRIVKATPELSLESKPTGDKRVITLRLGKLSEPSELSDENDEVEIGI